MRNIPNTIAKFGPLFSASHISITGLVCLGLLNSGDINAAAQIHELTEGYPPEKYASLFGFTPDRIWEDEFLRHEHLMQRRSGWLVSAQAARPMDIRCDSKGEHVASAFSYWGCFQFLVYHDVLEEALQKILDLTGEARAAAINEARKERCAAIVL